MKLFRFILPVALAFCFSGCLDVNENIEVRTNGSGELSMDMDMSQMVEMLQTFMSKEDMQKKGMDKMDTTILMKDIIDADTALSAEKKALLRPASVHIKMDIDGKIFKTHMLFPFSSQANLQKLYATMSDGSLGNAQLLKNMLPGGQGGGDLQQGGPSPDINQFNGVYDFVARDGLMSRKLNADRWKTLQSNSLFGQAKMAGQQMNATIDYTSTVKLPRAAKKVDNPLAKLSDDKRTVTFKYNLLDVFDHPEKFEYSIEY
jgi:hypothetical protein